MVAVVAEKGYQGRSVRDVLARAEISSRTFYELFANKEECFVAAYEEAAAFALALVREAFEGGSSPGDRVERAGGVLRVLGRASGEGMREPDRGLGAAQPRWEAGVRSSSTGEGTSAD